MWRLGVRAVCSLALGALGAGGCQFDVDNVCGSELSYNPELKACQCPEGTIRVNDGCQPCGEHQVIRNGKCECEEGYVASADQCELAATGLLDRCDSNAGTGCEGKVYDYCAPDRGAGGYCTSKACTASADCPAGFTCATWATPTYCLRPPVGAGQACQSDADCAGTEALLCEVAMTRTCFVRDCDLQKNDCSDGYTCCDLSIYSVPNLCVPEGKCPT